MTGEPRVDETEREGEAHDELSETISFNLADWDQSIGNLLSRRVADLRERIAHAQNDPEVSQQLHAGLVTALSWQLEQVLLTGFDEEGSNEAKLAAMIEETLSKAGLRKNDSFTEKCRKYLFDRCLLAAPPAYAFGLTNRALYDYFFSEDPPVAANQTLNAPTTVDRSQKERKGEINPTEGFRTSTFLPSQWTLDDYADKVFSLRGETLTVFADGDNWPGRVGSRLAVYRGGRREYVTREVKFDIKPEVVKGEDAGLAFMYRFHPDESIESNIWLNHFECVPENGVLTCAVEEIPYSVRERSVNTVWTTRLAVDQAVSVRVEQKKKKVKWYFDDRLRAVSDATGAEGGVWGFRAWANPGSAIRATISKLNAISSRA